MARPTEYAAPRIDTKVRLREDHRDLLAAAQIERGVGRNRLVEIALDEFFGLTSRARAPRMPRPAPDQALGGPTRSQGSSRTSPRVQQVGTAQAEQAEAKDVTPGRPTRVNRQVTPIPKTKHAPRRIR